MKARKTDNVIKRRLVAWVPENIHQAAKASAAREGIYLERWILEAVIQKLETNAK